LNELKTKDHYPLVETLDVVRKYNLKSAEAYILMKMGDGNKALDIYAKSFIKYFRKCIR